MVEYMCKTKMKMVLLKVFGQVIKFESSKEKFVCPVCGYKGPFVEIKKVTGVRVNAQCPNCCAFERHRLQKLVLNDLSKAHDFSKLDIIHFAPEPYFRKLFKKTFKSYISADLERNDVDLKIDLRGLPIEDNEFDVLYASHVLEHIKEDDQALSEISRILRPGGFAILEVPIVSEKTIEYDNAYESGHVRAPGEDYYEKYSKYFSAVNKYRSIDYSPIYQPYIIEDRTLWPTKEVPQRNPMEGEKHQMIVPVCYK